MRLLGLTTNSRYWVPALSGQYPGAWSWILYALDLLRPVAALALAMTVATGLLLLVWGHTVTTVLLGNLPHQSVLAGTNPENLPALAEFTDRANEYRLWLVHSQESAQGLGLPLVVGSGISLMLLFAPQVGVGLQWLGGAVAITGGVTWAAATLLAARLPDKLADLTFSPLGIDPASYPLLATQVGDAVASAVWHTAGAISHAGAVAMLVGVLVMAGSFLPCVYRSMRLHSRGYQDIANGRSDSHYRPMP